MANDGKGSRTFVSTTPYLIGLIQTYEMKNESSITTFLSVLQNLDSSMYSKCYLTQPNHTKSQRDTDDSFFLFFR